MKYLWDYTFDEKLKVNPQGKRVRTPNESHHIYLLITPPDSSQMDVSSKSALNDARLLNACSNPIL